MWLIQWDIFDGLLSINYIVCHIALRKKIINFIEKSRKIIIGNLQLKINLTNQQLKLLNNFFLSTKHKREREIGSWIYPSHNKRKTYSFDCVWSERKCIKNTSEKSQEKWHSKVFHLRARITRKIPSTFNKKHFMVYSSQLYVIVMCFEKFFYILVYSIVLWPLKTFQCSILLQFSYKEERNILIELKWF